MVFSTQRLFILLICIGFFTVQPAKSSSLRSIDIVLRWSKEDDGPALHYHRTLKAVEMQMVNTKKKHAPVNKTLDPNQSRKRSVRRGSDPIHNRS
ncbi:CLE45p like [Actinidia chinensis var. chinensis]|uniref:CLE45p like n=1 Tax=Actinidia chinensis var. chinensis TaxID=1590841 RepID=A0A2R6P450_ACTCC|nr:CLE45p like [Actinidia chinensis var. chinensis]